MASQVSKLRHGGTSQAWARVLSLTSVLARVARVLRVVEGLDDGPLAAELAARLGVPLSDGQQARSGRLCSADGPRTERFSALGPIGFPALNVSTGTGPLAAQAEADRRYPALPIDLYRSTVPPVVMVRSGGNPK